MSNKIYVGNLPKDDIREVTDEVLRLFRKVGTIRSIQLKDDFSGNCRGYGFLQMSSDQEAAEAIRVFDGALELRTVLTVGYARDQRPFRPQTPPDFYKGPAHENTSPIKPQSSGQTCAQSEQH